MKYLIDDILEYFYNSFKKEENFAIGLESERFGIFKDSFKSLPYDGRNQSINKVLYEIVEKYGFSPVFYDGNLMGAENSFSDISIEPGSQFEIALNPVFSFKELTDNYNTLNNILYEISQKHDFTWLAMGINPVTSYKEIKIIPKDRYRLMRNHFEKSGACGHQMMRCTTSVQVSLDYKSEEHFTDMFRCIYALAPVFVAWFANSSISPDLENDYLNKRSLIWSNTDPARCGIIPGVLSETFSFRDYIEYCLDVPMVFKYHENRVNMVDGHGISFREFAAGNKILKEDFFLHMTSVFTMARLKNFIELRYCDSLPVNELLGVPALFCGLFYSDKSIVKIRELIEGLNYIDLNGAIDEAARYGFRGKFRGRYLRDWAYEIFEISSAGLSDIENKTDFSKKHGDELINPLKDLIVRDKTLAEENLEILEESGIDSLIKLREIKGTI